MVEDLEDYIVKIIKMFVLMGIMAIWLTIWFVLTKQPIINEENVELLLSDWDTPFATMMSITGTVCFIVAMWIFFKDKKDKK